MDFIAYSKLQYQFNSLKLGSNELYNYRNYRSSHILYT